MPIADAVLDVGGIDAGCALAQGAEATASRMLPVQRQAWTRLLTTLGCAGSSAGTVQLLVLGDSLLAGSGGGYAKLFAESLGKLCGASVTFSNLAQGGSPTESVLPVLPSLLAEEADDSGMSTLLLMDHSINDSTFGDAKRVKAAVESELRWLLTARPRTALLLVESWWGSISPRASTHLMEAYAVAAHYGVAHVRFERAVRAERYEQAWGANCRPRQFDARCSVHPSWPTHELLMVVVNRSFAALAQSLCPGGRCPNAGAFAARPAQSDQQFELPHATSSPALLRELSVCTTPSRSYLASRRVDEKLEAPRVSKGNWTLYEDRQGKPGWVSTEAGSVIEFDLAFGSRPSVAVSYLLSHDSTFGEVLVRMTNVQPSKSTAEAVWTRSNRMHMWNFNRMRLYGSRTDGIRASTTSVVHLQAHQAIMQSHEMEGVRHPVYGAEPYVWPDPRVLGIMGFGIPPHATATMQIELCCPGSQSCKFKLIAITAC